MHATASVRVELDRDGRSVIRDLRSEPPVKLIPHQSRVANPDGPVVVNVVGSAAAPLGGDRIDLNVRVGAGARLQLVGTAASLALPGNNGDYSRMTVTIAVDEDGTAEYLPCETIATSFVDHRAEMHVDLARGARVRCQEMVVLGRYDETPGRLAVTTHVLRAGTPLLRQRLDVAGQRLIGSVGYLAGAKVLATETIAWDQDPPESVTGPWWSLTPLVHGGALATAIADDTVTARQRLSQACGHHPSGAQF